MRLFAKAYPKSPQPVDQLPWGHVSLSIHAIETHAKALIIPILGIIIPNMGMNKINISNALFSKAQQHVLGLLYSQPDKGFYTNEIIRLSKSGTGAVQRELAKLTAVGLVTIKRVGNQKHYQANRANPLFSELRSLVMKTFGLADIIRDAITPIAKHIHIAFIYGSIAKQEDTAASDIDLMVISDTLSYAELFKLLEETEIQLGRKINPTFYSRAEWIKKSKGGNHFVTSLSKQPKIFLIGTEDELAAIG
jgi:predicted nucleotidyltransferase